MNLAEWLKQDHSLGDQLEVMDLLCRGVAAGHRKSPPKALAVDPARIVAAGGDWRILEGTAAAAYRAPESMPGVPTTFQADIYSLGVIFYRMLAGRLPSGASPTPGAGAEAPPPALRDVRPDVPRELVDGITACLEADPDWRPKDLEYLLGVIEGMAAEHAPSPKPPPAPAAGKEASPGLAKRAASGSPAVLLAALAALLLVLGAAGWYLTSHAARGPEVVVEATPLPTVPTSLPNPSPSLAPSPSPWMRVSRPSPSPRPNPSRPPARPAVTASVPPSIAPAASSASVPSPSLPPSAAPEPAEPAVLTALSPPKVKRPGNVIIDVRGTGLRADHQARLLRGGEAAGGIQILRQRFVNPNLVQVVLRLDETAAPGPYLLLLADAQGRLTNARPLEVVR